MNMVCSIQEFVEAVTEELRKATPEVRAEFRAAWLAQVAAKQKESDRRFLRSVGIDPDGD